MQVVERVELLRQPANGDQPAEWVAQIGALAVPVVGYTVDGEDDGTSMVTLVVAAASVRVGGQPATGTAAVQQARPLRTWGAPGPDPRQGIPGWIPDHDRPPVRPLAEQGPPPIARLVAEQAASRAGVQVMETQMAPDYEPPSMSLHPGAVVPVGEDR